MECPEAPSIKKVEVSTPPVRSSTEEEAATHMKKHILQQGWQSSGMNSDEEKYKLRPQRRAYQHTSCSAWQFWAGTPDSNQ